MADGIEKIIERVQKLLNLAGNNPNENEAAAAIEKAHAILAEYNLTMATVQQHHASSNDAEDERGALKTETNFAEKQYRWIWGEVARLNFCRMVWLRPSSYARATHYTIVGRKINALVATQLAMYLCDTMRKLANEAAASHGRKDYAYRNAFMAGCAIRLCARMKALRFGTQGQQNALVLWTGNEDAANEAFIAENIGPLRKAIVRQSAYDSNGLAAGYKAGDSIGLDAQVGNTSKPIAAIGK